VSSDLAKKMIIAWLETKFLGGRHLKRVKLIDSFEKITPRVYKVLRGCACVGKESAK
jgi:hypothetical protein